MTSPAAPAPTWIRATVQALNARNPLPDLTGLDPEDPGWLEVLDRTGAMEVDRIVDHLGPGVAWRALIGFIKQTGTGIAGLQSLAEKAALAVRTQAQETQLRDAILWAVSDPKKFPVVREAFLRWRDPGQDAAFPAFANRCLHEAVFQDVFTTYLPAFKPAYDPGQVSLDASLPMAAIRSGHNEGVLGHWDWALSVTSPEALGAALFWALTREDPAMLAALDRAGEWPLPSADQLKAWAEEPEDWTTYDRLGVQDPEGLLLSPGLRHRLDEALRPLHDHLPQTRAFWRHRDLAQQPVRSSGPSRRRT